jgi:hypothetical protein
MTEEQSTTGTGSEGGPASPRPTAIGDLLASPQRQPNQMRKKKERRRHWPALLKRFPRLFPRSPEDEPWPGDRPLVPPESLTKYQTLESDIALWTRQLEPRFLKLDHRAQNLQNQFWRQRVMLIAGGLLATSLATIQAAVGGGNVYLAASQAVLTGLLAGLTVLIRSRRAQRGYLSARLRAEQIKSEFFLFLARAGDYAEGDRVIRLEQQVDNIEAGGLP